MCLFLTYIFAFVLGVLIVWSCHTLFVCYWSDTDRCYSYTVVLVMRMYIRACRCQFSTVNGYNISCYKHIRAVPKQSDTVPLITELVSSLNRFMLLSLLPPYLLLICSVFCHPNRHACVCTICSGYIAWYSGIGN